MQALHLTYRMNLLRCVQISKQSHYSKVEISVNRPTATKYLRLNTAVQPFSLAFPISDKVEAGFSHFNAVLTKQRNRLNVKERSDL